MDNNFETLILKKTLQKGLVNELFQKKLIDFSLCNNIIKKLDADINRLNGLLKNDEKLQNIVLKVLI